MGWGAVVMPGSLRRGGALASRRGGREGLVSLPETPPVVVAVPGAGLVAAAPVRPVQEMAGGVGGAAEGRVHPADLVHGDADHRGAVAAGNRIVTIAWPPAGTLSTGGRPPLWPGHSRRAPRPPGLAPAWRRHPPRPTTPPPPPPSAPPPPT